jgi:hypothetical protein
LPVFCCPKLKPDMLRGCAGVDGSEVVLSSLARELFT